MDQPTTKPPLTGQRFAVDHRLCGILIGLLTLVCHGEVPANSPLRRAPTFNSVDLARLPKPTLLATPEVRTLVGYTRRVLHLHDGHTLAVFSFSDSGSANWLFLIDSRDLSAQRFDMPNHDIGSHSAALGSDGNIYVMPYGTGRAYRFDTAKHQFTALPNIGLPPSELTWGAVGDSSGRGIYFGTYPNACLVKYDIVTGKADIRPHIVPGTSYVMDFSEDEAGIHCRAFAPGDHWLTINRRDFSVTPSKPQVAARPFVPPKAAAPDESIQYPTILGGRRFGIGWPSGRLLEFESNGRTTVRGDSRAPAELWFLESVGDDTLVGISHYGAVFRFDLKTNRFIRRDLPNLAAGANQITYLEAITPHCVIGGNYSQQNLFRIDPVSGHLQMFNAMISRFPGESMCAIGFGGNGYIGSYIHAAILKYDPEKPVGFGVNPRELTELNDRFAQTRPRDAATDGRHLFFTSDADYGKLGGALAEVDPGTGHVDVFPQVLKDQNLPSVAFDPKTHMLWISGDRWGDQRSAPPTQSTAVLAEWDPGRHKIDKTLTPWNPVDEVEILGCTSDGILIAAAVGQLALIDTTSGEVLWRGASPAGLISKLRRGADGAYYCLANGTLDRWQFPENTLTPVSITAGCTFLTEYRPGQWALANGSSVFRVRP
jgi:hypothetical protein